METVRSNALETLVTTQMDRLPELVQTLPQELYDNIYDLTFTPTSRWRYIRHDYKPPKLLSVDRASRALFATRYYGERAVFCIVPFSHGHGAKWLASLPQAHLYFTRRIQCGLSNVKPVTGKESYDQWVRLQDEWLDAKEDTSYMLGSLVEDECVYLQVSYGTSRNVVWISNLSELSEIGSALANNEIPRLVSW